MYFKHGMTGTRTFKSWESMKGRCTNPNDPSYAIFGGRGIKVCARWLEGFSNFLEDMGERPEGTSLDRKDVDGDYTPENCKWSTAKEQMRNRRNTRYLIWQNRKWPLVDLAEKHSLKPAVLVARLGSGWELERALNAPVTPGRGRKASTKGLN